VASGSNQPTSKSIVITLETPRPAASAAPAAAAASSPAAAE